MRLISNVGRETSCRVLLKTLNILPVPCVHIMEIVYCTKMSIVHLQQNSVRHNYNKCHRSDLQSQFCRADIKKKNLENIKFFSLKLNFFIAKHHLLHAQISVV